MNAKRDELAKLKSVLLAKYTREAEAQVAVAEAAQTGEADVAAEAQAHANAAGKFGADAALQVQPRPAPAPSGRGFAAAVPVASPARTWAPGSEPSQRWRISAARVGPSSSQACSSLAAISSDSCR